MKYALIGCGYISNNHIAAAIKNGLEIAAVCDLHESSMDRLIAAFNLPPTVKKYTDYRDMLSAGGVELAAVCTLSGTHAQIALDCLDAGVNVIVEKPLALSIADADAIIEKARLTHLKVCASHQNRFNPSVAFIRNAISEGRFGRMFYGTSHIRWNRDRDYYEKAPWRGTWAMDGGAMMNQCIHSLDILRWMLGNDIDEVFAYTDRLNHPYIETEDIGLAIVRFKNGTYGSVDGTTNAVNGDFEETLYLFGQNGTVKAGGVSLNTIEEWRFNDGAESADDVKNRFRNPPDIAGYAQFPLYADVIDAIKNDRQPFITAEDGKRAVELVLAIGASAASGKPVRFPLTDCATVDFIGRFGAGSK